jgi:hypothetical protein
MAQVKLDTFLALTMSFGPPTSAADKLAEAALALAHINASPKCPLCKGSGKRLAKPKGKRTEIQMVLCACTKTAPTGIAAV